MTHAQFRLKHRYGIKPTSQIMRMIAMWIRTNAPNVKYKRPAAGKADIYIVKLKGFKIPTVWDWCKKYIVTFLPEGAA